MYGWSLASPCFGRSHQCKNGKKYSFAYIEDSSSLACGFYFFILFNILQTLELILFLGILLVPYENPLTFHLPTPPRPLTSTPLWQAFFNRVGFEEDEAANWCFKTSSTFKDSREGDFMGTWLWNPKFEIWNLRYAVGLNTTYIRWHWISVETQQGAPC